MLVKYDGNRSKPSMREIDLKRSTPMPKKTVVSLLNITMITSSTQGANFIFRTSREVGYSSQIRGIVLVSRIKFKRLAYFIIFDIQYFNILKVLQWLNKGIHNN